MKKVILITCLVVLGISCVSPFKEVCEEPNEVYKYRKENLKGFEIIDKANLRADWSEFIEENIVCPTKIDYDFTNDGNKDFICMLKDSTGVSYLVTFNNYETTKISYHVIDGIADYGNYGIGNVIYLDKDAKGFYSYKLESSNAYIHWENNEYLVEYND